MSAMSQLDADIQSLRGVIDNTLRLVSRVADENHLKDDWAQQVAGFAVSLAAWKYGWEQSYSVLVYQAYLESLPPEESNGQSDA